MADPDHNQQTQNNTSGYPPNQFSRNPTQARPTYRAIAPLPLGQYSQKPAQAWPSQRATTTQNSSSTSQQPIYIWQQPVHTWPNQRAANPQSPSGQFFQRPIQAWSNPPTVNLQDFPGQFFQQPVQAWQQQPTIPQNPSAQSSQQTVQPSHTLAQARTEFESLNTQQSSNSQEESGSSEDIQRSEDDEQDPSDEDDDAHEGSGLGFRVPGALLSGNRGDGIPRGRGGRGMGTIRGPRKPAEPTGDIKLRLGQATEAFIRGNYLEARDTVFEIIRINAETLEAWTILSSIQMELGDTVESANSLATAAGLRPKELSGWINAAKYALRQTSHRDAFLSIAYYCYSSAIRADVEDLESRFGKADIKLERGQLQGAISDYQRILKYSPYNLAAVRRLGAAYFDHKEVKKAIQLYKTTFDYQRSFPDNCLEFADWNDISIYITLFEHEHEYKAAIGELKSVARWLLGRESEAYFDTITTDDCEWDMDDSRRAHLPSFVPGRFPLSAYGEGLPLELRVKMGACRLKLGQRDEAIRHLDCLNQRGEADHNWIIEHHHLYLEAGGILISAGLYQDALSLYESIKRVPELATAYLYIQMAKCFQGNGLGFKAEEHLQTAIEVDEDNTDARIELARICEALGQEERAFTLINEAIAIKKKGEPQTIPPPQPRRKYRKKGVFPIVAPPSSPPPPEPSNNGSLVTVKKPRNMIHRRILADPIERLKGKETTRAEQLHSHYVALKAENMGMRGGDSSATRRWMEAANDLTNDFRSSKSLYPFEKIVRFLGYTGDRPVPVETPLDPDLSAISDRLSRNLGGDLSEEIRAQTTGKPADYREISFPEWLDIFLEYALCLARNEKAKESYEICQAAADSIVFCDSKEDMFLIHVTYCTCAVLAGDEKTCITTALFFMKEYQFTSDSYRMFAAVSRMCNSPIRFLHDATTQKFIRRQIKAMDYALVDEHRRNKFFRDKPFYSIKDENGRKIVNDDLDIALLMLYGHIHYAGQSHTAALNYYFRAYTLDPENSMINLIIGLCYSHDALKRGAENRQHLILQSLTFIMAYYESRQLSNITEERQEAHFNVARVYHMLGLTHLALPYYLLVLEEIKCNNTGEPPREDLIKDTAYNMQTIYATTGNPELAFAITNKWLVV